MKYIRIGIMIFAFVSVLFSFVWLQLEPVDGGSREGHFLSYRSTQEHGWPYFALNRHKVSAPVWMESHQQMSKAQISAHLNLEWRAPRLTSENYREWNTRAAVANLIVSLFMVASTAVCLLSWYRQPKLVQFGLRTFLQMMTVVVFMIFVIQHERTFGSQFSSGYKGIWWLYGNSFHHQHISPALLPIMFAVACTLYTIIRGAVAITYRVSSFTNARND